MSNTEALRAAAQQALDAMNYSGMDVGKFNRINAACRALREALTASTHPADVSKSGAQSDMPAASGEPAEPFAHICVLPTKDAGPTKFFTAPSDPRGFPVYRAPQPAPARVPLPDEMMQQCRAECDDDYTKRGIFISGWIGAERAHGITAPGAPDAPTQPESNPRR